MDVGVIGTGVMGRNHIRVLSELKDVNSIGIFDINESLVNMMNLQYDVSVYKTIEDLIQNSDIVNVCVSTQHHYDVAKQVLLAKKHLFVEKPLCLTSDSAEALLNFISDDIITGVGHIERFNPIVSEIKKIVKNPLYIEMKRHNPSSLRVVGSSVVEDLMIHDIDILFNVFSIIPDLIYAIGNPNVCSVLIRCDKLPITLSTSRKALKKIRIFYIEDEDFTIEGDFMKQEITIYQKPGKYQIEGNRYIQENVIENVTINKVEPLKVEISTFISCVKKFIPFPITFDQSINNLKFCEQISRLLVE